MKETLMSSLRVSVSKHLLDEDYTLLWANDCYYKMTGYTKEEYETLFHNRCSEYFTHDPQEFTRIFSTVQDAYESGEDGYELICHMPQKGGGAIWIRFVGTFTTEKVEGVPVVVVVYIDVSDLIQTQKEQTVTYDHLPGFVAKFRIENGFQLVSANDRFLEFYGNQAVGGHFQSLVTLDTPENKKVITENYEAMRTGKSVHFVLQERKQNGGDVWLQLNAECVDWQNGSPVFLVVYIDITDVTELLELKKELENRSELLVNALTLAEHANRAKSDFLSRMSHDIRTPMNAILGMIAIAKRSLDDPKRVADCLEKEEKAAKFLLSLINDILDMSKIESGKMILCEGRFDMEELIENISSIFHAQAQERKLKFIVNVDPHVKGIFIGDELKLNQILMNLLGNAMKFTNAGGRVEFSVRLGKRKEEQLELIFTVEDTGMGMSEEFLKNVFIPFEQDSQQRENLGGSGLGLAIAANFARIMNGFIDVKSELNVGSTFTTHVWLKASEDQQKQKEKEAALPQEVEDFQGKRVLLVEDNEINLEIAEVILSSRNFAVETARNGQEAFELFCEREAGYYFAVLMDIQMPVMDGLEATRKIRSCKREDAKLIPIIAMSANAFDDDMEKSLAAGMNNHISKPIDIPTLFRVLSHYEQI